MPNNNTGQPQSGMEYFTGGGVKQYVQHEADGMKSDLTQVGASIMQWVLIPLLFVAAIYLLKAIFAPGKKKKQQNTSARENNTQFFADPVAEEPELEDENQFYYDADIGAYVNQEGIIVDETGEPVNMGDEEFYEYLRQSFPEDAERLIAEYKENFEVEGEDEDDPNKPREGEDMMDWAKRTMNEEEYREFVAENVTDPEEAAEYIERYERDLESLSEDMNESIDEEILHDLEQRDPEAAREYYQYSVEESERRNGFRE